MKEKCGVFGIYSHNGINVTPMVVMGLQALQHRGQESWGVAIKHHVPLRKMGLVSQGSREIARRKNMKGQSGIGHVRYSTLGASMLDNAHPIPIGNRFSIAHNGTIINTDYLQKKISGEFAIPKSVTDTKLVGLMILQELKKGRDWFQAFENVSKEIVGAYAFTFIDNKGDIYGARDPAGFRPLCIGWHEPSASHVISSESCALSAIGAKLVRDVKPGEIVMLGKRDIESHSFADGTKVAHCAFEYTYFAHPSSKIDGINVYDSRKRIGRILGKTYPMKGDVIIPVPDSARPAALGYSEETGIAFEEGLIKDRYRQKGSMRSFIEPSSKRRENIIKQIIPIPSTIEGKDVIVVDDSIVRGASATIITKLLKRAGAKKIRMALTFPPIAYPCYMGIDFPTQEELLAYMASDVDRNITKVRKEVARKIRVDELRYNDVKALGEGIGIPLNKICASCVTGDYSPLGIKPKFKTRNEMKS